MNIDSTLSLANGKNPANIGNLTDDQKKAYTGLIEFINADYNENDFKRALIGQAGTGKTYILKAIIKNCKYAYPLFGWLPQGLKAVRVFLENLFEVLIIVILFH